MEKEKIVIIKDCLWASLGIALLSIPLLINLKITNCFSGCISSHVEGISLVTLGKFQNGFLLTDAFSGNAPIYYHFLGDFITNLISRVVQSPPLEVSFFIGRLLFPFFFISCFISLRITGVSSRSSFISSLIAVLFTDSMVYSIVEWFNTTLHMGWIFHAERHLFHTPYNSLLIAVGNSYAYMLIPPTMAFYLKYIKENKKLSLVFSGIFFSALLITHSLTAMAVITAIGSMEAYFIYSGINKNKSFFLIPLGMIIVIFSKYSPIFFLMPSIIIGYAIYLRSGFKSIFLFFIPIGLTALYIVLCIINAGFYSIGTTFSPIEINTAWQMLLFLPPLLLLSKPKNSLKNLYNLEIIAFLSCALLGLGIYWGFNNHPYRFTTYAIIFLIFPIGISLDNNGNVLRKFFAFLILFPMMAINIKSLAATEGSDTIFKHRANYQYGKQYKKLSIDEKSMLMKISEITESNINNRFLTSPETKYPINSTLNGILLSYSKNPGLIADPRYTGKYTDKNWIEFYCLLFPKSRIEDARYAHIREYRSMCSNDNQHPPIPLNYPKNLKIFTLVGGGIFSSGVSEGDASTEFKDYSNKIYTNYLGSIYELDYLKIIEESSKKNNIIGYKLFEK
jgi:hypothetical protein